MRRALTVLFLHLLAFPIRSENRDVFVGILEQETKEMPPGWEDAPHLETATFIVRPMFVRTQGGWTAMVSPEKSEPLESFPGEWNVAFDGASLGTIKTMEGPAVEFPDFYVRDRVLTVSDKEFPKVINKQKKEWFWFWGGQVSYRPLVLVSKPYFKDPQQWKPFPVPNGYKSALFPIFKKTIGKLMMETQGAEGLSEFIYTDKDLTLKKGYRTLSGKELLEVEVIKRNSSGIAWCCYLPNDERGDPVSAQWFLKTGTSIKHVGESGEGMDLVDAGDYDGDGSSELIFFISEYNRNGYAIFDGEMNEEARYIWGYH